MILATNQPTGDRKQFWRAVAQLASSWSDVSRLTVMGALLLTATMARAAAPAELPPVRLVPKPSDSAVERRAHPQPTVPEGTKEVPFSETAPEPALTELEKERGYVLFQRPVTECVYPNTRPLPDERLEALVAFATPGEFESVTLALYPARALQNLRVRASSLRCAFGEIPAARIDVRLATYWNVGYPAYTTLKTYRRVPELLERVTVHTSPARECQWYWLTIQVPDDSKPGLYRGTVTVWDDGYAQAVEIPLALRVLGFHLQKDPRKHFSAYFYVRNRALYKGRDEAFIRKAADKDYQAMADFGLDMLPTLYLRCDDDRRIVLAEPNELERMLAAGLKGPAPVTADNVIARLYRDTTPGGQRGNHWRVNPLPPPAFYRRVTELFRAFELERKAKGWPEFICCPIDEVDPSCKEFGAGVYAAVKAAGLRTYATKDPVGADAADYAPYIDIWCSQPYSVPYERIVSQNRYEYWCYPNHNAGEIKDRRTMCKGGRMTYGFGLWRSGYTTLIPWNWCWPSEPDPFDYLRGRFSGCGQRVDDDGEVIPAVYWACFREGYDDGRYLYTLQQALVQRQGSKDPACLAALGEGRRLLQETWDAIRVQPRYLADGMWPSDEFDAIRWRLAAQTARLLEFPATSTAAAPSVLVNTSAPPTLVAQRPSPYDTAAHAGSLEKFDLGGDFAGWKNGTAEGRAEVTEAARHADKIGLRWTVGIDHKHDGGEGGHYPIGWPRIAREFKPGELDMSRYDTLEFWVRIDSTRDEAAADRTPIGLVISSQGKKTSLYSKTVDLGDQQRVWIPLRFPVKQMMKAADSGAEPWKSVSRVQLYFSERDYADGTRLILDIGEVSLLRLTAPMISAMDAPADVLLPRRSLVVAFNLIGTGSVAKGSHTIAATLEDPDHAVRAEARQDLMFSPRMALPLPALEPGAYTLRLMIRDAGGKTCSELAQPVTAFAGPLY
jgi:Glycoside hydrolase 123 N-terminal domain